MLLIVGFDGATWDLINPWIDRGWLPNLQRLRERSISGPLTSTVPPVTLPSWTTFMTGVNPGKHGIFDFTRRDLGTYNVRFVNSTFRKVPTIWQRLSDAGKRVCVLGLPGTYPPEPLNGCMVCGFDTPVTLRADDRFVWPPELAALVREQGGFPFADFQEFRVDGDWYATARDRLLRGIDIKTGLALRLLAREEWDAFLIMFGESDTAAHHFWRFSDQASPRFDAVGAESYGDVLPSVYRALDAALGRLRDAVPEAEVLVVSDHGFGGAGLKVVHLNQWLTGLGLQTRRVSRGAGLAGRLKTAALRRVPAPWQAPLFRLGGGAVAGRLESRSRFAQIEWSKTRVFSEELGYFPSAWINLRGREPQGIVDVADYERVRDDICAAAATLTDGESGRSVIRRAWRREELYQGDWVKYAPDVIFEMALDDGYSYACLPTGAATNPMHRLDPQLCRGGKLAGMDGTHRTDGIYLLETAVSVPASGRRAAIADMAATILSCCDLDVPHEFDGRTVLTGISADVVVADNATPIPWQETQYTSAEEREIADRLASMGYLQ